MLKVSILWLDFTRQEAKPCAAFSLSKDPTTLDKTHLSQRLITRQGKNVDALVPGFDANQRQVVASLAQGAGGGGGQWGRPRLVPLLQLAPAEDVGYRDGHVGDEDVLRTAVLLAPILRPDIALAV